MWCSQFILWFPLCDMKTSQADASTGAKHQFHTASVAIVHTMFDRLPVVPTLLALLTSERSCKLYNHNGCTAVTMYKD